MKKRGITLLLVLALLAGVLPAHAAEASGPKLAAITFDDGPGPYTNSLLDGLEQRGVAVTFFMLGCQAAQYPAVVKRAYEAGHQIASHTYSHPQLTQLGSKSVQKQLADTAAVLNQATGTRNTYMVRPPYGSVNAHVLSLLNAPAVLWTVDTLDWQSRNADAIYQHIVNDTKDGSIVLLHDIYATTVSGALRGIDALLAQGYELVTVSELLRRRGYDAAPGRKYSSAPGRVTLPGIAQPAIAADEREDGRYVTLTADAGTAIYYTLDGTAPTSQSAVYTGPFLLEKAGTVKAFAAYSLNGARSQVSERALEEPRLKAPVITLANESAVITANGDIHYTLDGTEPTAASECYTGPVPLPAGTIIRAAAMRPGYQDSPVSSLLHSERGNLFSDVLPTAAYYHAVDEAVSLGVLAAEGQAFFPERPVTRQELAEVLYRLDGRAAGLQILNGYEEDAAGLDAPVTREGLAAALFQIWGEAPDDSRPPTKLYGFADWMDIHVEAWDAMDWVVANGVLNGVSETVLAPRSAVTRGQLASILMRSQGFWAGAEALA